ncbi:MAG: protease modulator HflC [Peptostreptococcaceae bacterium]|nr:protease modulator HflC [Peptostreptococcaceae bacterium]
MEDLFNKFQKKFEVHGSDGEERQERRFKTPDISKKGIMIVVLVFLAYIIATNSLFTVNEMEQAVITRFGEVQTVIVEKITPELEAEIYDIPQFKDVKIREGKGLFFKVPVIDQVEKYTSRLLTYNTLAREVTTSDKKKIVLDNNAQWVIRNPLLFRITVNNIRSANTKLDDIMYSKLNEKIGLTDGSTLISDKAYVYAMTNQIRINTNEEVSNFGMEVIDVRIAKTELPESNYENIFNRMRTERQKIANKFRAEGEEQYKIMTAQASKEVTILKAEAYEIAQTIQGEGDALALETYANAYNKDPEFYAFYRTLESYKKTLGEKTKLVIGADSEFAKYLYGTE